jgi:hypothetical protein
MARQGRGAIDDLRECTAPPTPSAGIVGFTLKHDGRFSYWSYGPLGALNDFARCMKARGYHLSTVGTDEQTDFAGKAIEVYPQAQ